MAGIKGLARQVGATALSQVLDSSESRLRLRSNFVSRSRGISCRPVAGRVVVAIAVILVEGGDLGHERIIRVGVSQQRADRQKNLGNGQGGRPLILEDVEANRTVRVDVRVVNFRSELQLRGLEGLSLIHI